MFCLATGSPIPTISWQQDGRPVSRSDRINIFTFAPRLDSDNDTDFTSPNSRVSSITNLLMMNSDLPVQRITSLGGLGIVGVLSIDVVVRGDTGNYTCTVSNQLPETTVITETSDAVPLVVLGKALSLWIALC